MATKQQVRDALAKHDGTWDESADTMDAPAGMLWASNGCHEIAIPWGEYLPGQKWTAPERWQDALDSLASGVHPCDLQDCERCEERGVVRQ